MRLNAGLVAAVGIVLAFVVVLATYLTLTMRVHCGPGYFVTRDGMCAQRPPAISN